jgi:hypothetical protein
MRDDLHREVERLVQASNAATDEAEKAHLLKQAEDLLMRDRPTAAVVNGAKQQKPWPYSLR